MHDDSAFPSSFTLAVSLALLASAAGIGLANARVQPAPSTVKPAAVQTQLDNAAREAVTQLNRSAPRA